jgi:methanogenic corrinoid protein MtbC1
MLRQHRHLCAFFQTLEERYRVLLPFVREGIERGEKALHVIDPARRTEHRSRLRAGGIDVARAETTGQLEVVGWDQVYLSGGHFDPDAVLAFLGRALGQAREAGFPLARVIGEAEWAMQNPSWVEESVRYEARVNSVFAGCRDPLLCTYDRSRFGAGVAMDVLAVHPAGVIGGVVQPSPLFGAGGETRHARGGAGLSILRRRYLAALLAGSRRDALDVLIEDGLWLDVPVSSLYLDVLEPVLREVGRLWQERRISVAQVGVATEICKCALAQLHALLPCAPNTGRLVVVACVEGEQHDIGARMVADFLEMAGFEVRFLGASVPTETLAAVVEEQPPQLLALSVTTDSNLGALRRAVATVGELGKGRVPVAVGGQLVASRPPLRREPGVALYARNAGEAAQAVLRLLGRSAA